MATNPMQRRSRNSFLLGALLMTLILGIVIGLLFMAMTKIQKENQELKSKTICVVTKDISSGNELNAGDLTEVKVSSSAFPANAISRSSLGEKNIAKINLKKGTAITADMLYIDKTEIGNDVRIQEYNTIILPMDLITGDFVDVRLLLPSGQDFIVVSKKKVEIPQIAGVDSKDTINIELSEDEILTMSNAIVEAYMINGSKLYATKYTDGGNQEASTPTYPVNGEVAKLIENNKNVLPEALNALRNRYNRDLRENYINPALQSQDDALGNEQSKMQESITKSESTREEYLQSLSGAVSE